MGIEDKENAKSIAESRKMTVEHALDMLSLINKKISALQHNFLEEKDNLGTILQFLEESEDETTRIWLNEIKLEIGKEIENISRELHSLVEHVDILSEKFL
jgi:hypothetical protein